jgi:hypothetical protein
MAPPQHHFELVGWNEITIVIRFWIIAGLCVALGLAVSLRRVGQGMSVAPAWLAGADRSAPWPSLSVLVPGSGCPFAAADALLQLGASVTVSTPRTGRASGPGRPARDSRCARQARSDALRAVPA